MVNSHEIPRRTQRARELVDGIAASRHASAITVVVGGVPSYLRVGARLAPSLVQALWSFGVRPSYPMPLSEHPEMQRLMDRVTHHQGAQTLAKELASFPCHHRVSDGDVEQILKMLSGCDHD